MPAHGSVREIEAAMRLVGQARVLDDAATLFLLRREEQPTFTAEEVAGALTTMAENLRTSAKSQMNAAR